MGLFKNNVLIYKKANSLRKSNSHFPLKNAKGIAVVEMLPLLAIFITLFGLTFGFWTSIHKGILQSIAARHYAFEVINRRTHFEYHRDTDIVGGQRRIEPEQYYGYGTGNNGRFTGYRFFAVVKSQTDSDELSLLAETAELSLFDTKSLPDKMPDLSGNTVDPIPIKTGYGICINFLCGGR